MKNFNINKLKELSDRFDRTTQRFSGMSKTHRFYNEYRGAAIQAETELQEYVDTILETDIERTLYARLPFGMGAPERLLVVETATSVVLEEVGKVALELAPTLRETQARLVTLQGRLDAIITRDLTNNDT